MATPQYKPLGYAQIANLASAVGLGATPTGAVMALISVSGGAVRWRDDVTPPTASAGMPVSAGQEFQYSGNFAAIKFITSSGSPVLDIAFYKTHFTDRLAL